MMLDDLAVTQVAEPLFGSSPSRPSPSSQVRGLHELVLDVPVCSGNGERPSSGVRSAYISEQGGIALDANTGMKVCGHQSDSRPAWRPGQCSNKSPSMLRELDGVPPKTYLLPSEDSNSSLCMVGRTSHRTSKNGMPSKG